MKRKILFLDDTSERFAQLCIDLPNDQIIWVQTVPAFLFFARNYYFDKIMMDHDLNTWSKDPEDFFLMKEQTGETACIELAKDPGFAISTLITIHSHNPVGARKMEQHLKDAGFNVICREF